MKLVSVIINCYNGEKFLKAAIDSVIEQSYKNWELIFWDNQSTDSSALIVKSYDDPRIKYFYASSHTDLYAARKKALEITSGEYVAFLDVDDIWFPKKLEVQVEQLNGGEFALSYTNYLILNEKTKKTWEGCKKPLPSGWIAEELLADYAIGLSTIMLKKDVCMGSVNFDERYHIIGDFDLVIRIAIRYKIGAINDVMAVYRRHGQNISFLQVARHARELETWTREIQNSGNPLRHSSLEILCAFVWYLKAIGALLEGRRKDAFLCLKHINKKKFKFRVFVGLLLPTKIVRLIKQ